MTKYHISLVNIAYGAKEVKKPLLDTPIFKKATVIYIDKHFFKMKIYAGNLPFPFESFLRESTETQPKCVQYKFSISKGSLQCR